MLNSRINKNKNQRWEQTIFPPSNSNTCFTKKEFLFLFLLPFISVVFVLSPVRCLENRFLFLFHFFSNKIISVVRRNPRTRIKNKMQQRFLILWNNRTRTRRNWDVWRRRTEREGNNIRNWRFEKQKESNWWKCWSTRTGTKTVRFFVVRFCSRKWRKLIIYDYMK